MIEEVPGPRPRSLVRVAAALLSLAPPVAAQLVPAPKPVTVVRGGTVHVGNGDVIEGGAVVVRGSRIEAVGKGLAVPEGATVIDATGRHVYPGLVDAESTLLLDALTRQGGEGNVATSVVDALDPFETDALEDALRAGVTTVGVSTRRGLLDGASAALKLSRRAGVDDLVLRRDVALTATFGLNGDRPSVRLREWKTLTDLLDATKKYVEQWDDYQEKLEEYKKELEKARKEGEQKKPEEPKKEGAPTPAPETPTPPQQDKREDGPPQRRPWPRRRPGGLFEPILRELAEGPPGAPQQQPPPAVEKKEEGPKKPPRPARDPQKEALRRLLEGKIALNVYVDRAADLETLFELAKRYRFQFSVTGARDASRLADELAAAGVSVVVVQPHDLASEHLGTAAELDRAGVNVVLTTAGHSGGATRHLALSAAAAVAGGMDKERALAAITSRAAVLLGVADRVGTLEAGKDADLVVTRGEIFSSSAVVEQVLVSGAPAGAR